MSTSTFLVLVFCIITILPLTAAQFCLNQVNSSAYGPVPEVRNLILSSLAANGAFFHVTLPLDSGDTFYALGLCRGDLSNKTCYACLSSASQAVIDNCTNHKEAMAFWDHCMVRYSNNPFFDEMDSRPAVFGYSTGNVSPNYMDKFDLVLSRLVHDLIVRAAAGSSTLKFATGNDSYTVYDHRVYALVQCVPTLSSPNCFDCLIGAVDDYRSNFLGTQYVNIWRPSCSFRYNLNPFLESPVGGAPPPPPMTVVEALPPPPPTNTGAPKSKITNEGNRSRKSRTAIIIAVPVSVFLILVIGCAFFRLRKRGNIKSSQPDIPADNDGNIDLPIFNLNTIAEATNFFSNSNKIGEGGFGPVFKGQLSNGKLIAVKRNSENSKQGLREFKNEVILFSKLQHRNLLKLLGCCIQGEERMLIYEYMPNGSLNSFIFGNKSNSLNWSRRFNIIVGIARGLLYLHRDSRLRIIHRDLKASNVLLDNEMNPKIADFGCARAFGGDQLSEKTLRVIGTYGYMSPEYVIDGLFSVKSDVFSFGVLVLEIVTGKRNREFSHSDHSLTLLGHAWKLWIEGKALELVDEQMEGSFPASELLKCVQVGLLCVQQRPEDRPTMSSVLLALDSESAILSQPEQPGFYIERSTNETQLPLDAKRCTVNEVSITVLSGR